MSPNQSDRKKFVMCRFGLVQILSKKRKECVNPCAFDWFRQQI